MNLNFCVIYRGKIKPVAFRPVRIATLFKKLSNSIVRNLVLGKTGLVSEAAS